FFRQWLCVGREEQLPQPGDYFVATIGREGVIVVRDAGGSLHAFYNVCRHRGTQICQEHQGQFSETIQCPYHSWAWSLDGQLLGAPSTQGIIDFNKADYPLHRVALETWEGFIFICLGAKPPALPEVLEPVVERAGMYALPTLRSFQRIEYDVQ